MLKIRAGGSWPEYFGGSVLQWLVMASSLSLWKKPIWEGVWHHLDPMDSVCLRTVSMNWSVPGKYGPHGELFFVRHMALVPCQEMHEAWQSGDLTERPAVTA